ncbi:MAG: LacI family transcriptional regulator [Hyphomicrobiales bacterium]|nr:MAG: LacI family transcriptional regulator [Hyphomicrobiales bacterium]
MANIPRKKPTSYDVAKLAGVHRSAVSRAFSDGGSISAKTKEKVMKAAEVLEYRVNFFARGLQKQNSGLVGIVASRLDTPYRAKQVKLASHELIRNGYTPILLTVDKSDDVSGHMSNLLNYNITGMIVTSDTPPAKIIEECIQYNVPIVLINRDPSITGTDRIQLDIEHAGQMAFDMLRRGGAKKFGVLMPQSQTYTVVGRAEVFAQKCRDAGLPISIIKTSGQSYTAGIESTQIVYENLANIDAIFCTTDLMAFGLLDGLRTRYNIAVPERLEMLGFDDIEQASWAGYNLSTINQDIQESAVAAVSLMMKRLEQPEKPLETISILLKPMHRSTTLINV